MFKKGTYVCNGIKYGKAKACDIQCIFEQIITFGFKRIVLDPVKSYLLSRRQRVKINNIVSDYMITCGVPQGTVLGSLRFLINYRYNTVMLLQ